MMIAKSSRIMALLAASLVLSTEVDAATVTDFNSWTLLQDPADPNFDGTSTESIATLSALGGPIGQGTDVGFGTTNANTVAGSSSGNYFDASNDFEIAIDYSVSFANTPVGSLALGFGIGEDAAGENSAGVSFLTQNGAAILTYGGAARIDDVTQTPVLLSTNAALSGSLFVGYEAATGNITVGASQTAGAAAPDDSETFTGLQNQWNDEDLLASFFIRSDGIIPGSGWISGTADAAFTNFRVLQGTATPVAVPEPNAFWLLGIVGVVGVRRARKLRATGSRSSVS